MYSSARMWATRLASQGLMRSLGLSDGSEAISPPEYPLDARPRGSTASSASLPQALQPSRA